MELSQLRAEVDTAAIGERIHGFMFDLFPICRSITGDGLRATLGAVGERLPLAIHEVPTGTSVLDWTVPREWNIREAWIKDATGRRVVDLAASSLHVLNYSVPVRARLSRAELDDHLFSLPEHPDWIPYRTSYFKEAWGFCLAHRVRESLPEGEYDVCIDSALSDGSLTYGECLIPGEREGEILLSCHSCHPSLANDNLSGVALVTALGEHLRRVSPRWSYRLLFAPGTIGAITWLARNRDGVDRIRAGLVVACVGDGGRFHYKRSRRGDAEIDRAVAHVLARSGEDHDIRDFSPYGYDERQYCSPGFNLPVGSLTRTPHGQFPQYHTSADDLDLVRPEHLAQSFARFLEVIDHLERNRTYLNLCPHGEPQLGRRGLYRTFGGLSDAGQRELAMLWVLNLSDGAHDMLAIANRSSLPFDLLCNVAATLETHGLLREVTP